MDNLIKTILILIICLWLFYYDWITQEEREKRIESLIKGY